MVYYIPMNSRDSNTSQKPPKALFVAVTMAIFFLTLSAADSIGFVPDYVDGTGTFGKDVRVSELPELGEEPTAVQPVTPAYTYTAPTQTNAVKEKPTQIEIPAIGLDLKIQNPATRDIAALDELLKNGPARYVDSAQLGEVGNMIIFAHSSHLRVVHNQMYKAFNRIPELQAGDSITITGASGTEYRYVVTSVKKVNAEYATIPLQGEGTKLTLVTCDTLTSKSSRYVLEAELAYF